MLARTVASDCPFCRCLLLRYFSTSERDPGGGISVIEHLLQVTAGTSRPRDGWGFPARPGVPPLEHRHRWKVLQR